MTKIVIEHHTHRTNGWLPRGYHTQKKWLEDTVKHVDNNPRDFHPVIKEFERMIESNSRLYLLFVSMFDQLPSKKPYGNDYRRVRDYHHMLQLLNHIMTTAPLWRDQEQDPNRMGFPIDDLFAWPMGTPSGVAIFLDPQVNAMLKKVLNGWADYLKSPESREVLGTDSNCWFSPAGKEALTAAANAARGTSLAFEELYICDPSAPYYGFTSWDHFFTRLFREEVRPVAGPDSDETIVNSCESRPYRVAYNVQRRDKFWVKGQPYSVLDMLAQDELAEQFVGGTIYQAFLSPLSYHRWHSPVSGKVIKTYAKDGTYFSKPVFDGFADPDGQNPLDDGSAQGYASAVATRAFIYIQADNPDIELMCVMPVGLEEVSTCEVTVHEGQHVKKGDQLGMFHFGGSTHCLFFRKGVDVRGFPEPCREETNFPVRGKLAVVHSSGKT